jgi:hypothetical protein
VVGGGGGGGGGSILLNCQGFAMMRDARKQKIAEDILTSLPPSRLVCPSSENHLLL